MVRVTKPSFRPCSKASLRALRGGFEAVNIELGPGGSERHYYLRHHVFRPYDERPIYSYGYGYDPAWSYDYYAPPLYYGPSEY